MAAFGNLSYSTVIHSTILAFVLSEQPLVTWAVNGIFYSAIHSPRYKWLCSLSKKNNFLQNKASTNYKMLYRNLRFFPYLLLLIHFFFFKDLVWCFSSYFIQRYIKYFKFQTNTSVCKCNNIIYFMTQYIVNFMPFCFLLWPSKFYDQNVL